MAHVRATMRPTSWWLQTLQRRAGSMEEPAALKEPVAFATEEERRHAVKFFNAAFRAEQSGITQAHELASSVSEWDPDLGAVLRLYGDEEGWHQQILTDFLSHLGGSVQPMGRVTSLLFHAYGRAKRHETIVLTNLLFETIGATTYRMALRHARAPAIRQMLTILTRDESFHVPLNVFFLRRTLERCTPGQIRRLQLVHQGIFVSLLLLPLASRPKSKAFDKLGARDLMRAYATHMAELFVAEPDIPLSPPWWALRLLGIKRREVERGADQSPVGMAAAERAADRQNAVTAL